MDYGELKKLEDFLNSPLRSCQRCGNIYAMFNECSICHNVDPKFCDSCHRFQHATYDVKYKYLGKEGFRKNEDI